VQADQVTIIGPVDLPSTVPYHASQMFGRNVLALLQHLIKEGNVVIDIDDEITGAMLVTHQGKVLR
jgi:NAD(P) transhydrogenase subunit alpha